MDESDDTRQPDSQSVENPSRKSSVTFDAAYQNIEPGIFGLDTSMQARFRLINIEGRFTRYVETSPSDILDVSQLKVVYPMRLGRSFTVGGALGIYNLAGNNSNTGISFALPLSYQAPDSNWEFGMTPLWTSINGNSITDVDYRISYRTSKTNYFAGHRAINTGSQLLSGPYVGLGFNF